MSLIYGITKIVSEKALAVRNPLYIELICREAFEELMRVAPKGDLRIHLSIESDYPADYGDGA